MIPLLGELTHSDAAAARLRKWVHYYFGDTTPGETTKRFHAAVQHLMDEWARWEAVSSSGQPAGSVREPQR